MELRLEGGQAQEEELEKLLAARQELLHQFRGATSPLLYWNMSLEATRDLIDVTAQYGGIITELMNESSLFTKKTWVIFLCSQGSRSSKPWIVNSVPKESTCMCVMAVMDPLFTWDSMFSKW